MTETIADLKEVFKRSGLWRSGWTFEKAMECNVIRQSLGCAVRASRKKQKKQGNPAPLQPELFQETTS